MKKNILIIVALVSIGLPMRAQAPAKQKPSLHSINSIGLLNGSKGLGFLLQSIWGASIDRSFAGIGIGLDYYSLRSAPLFVDLRYELGRRKRNLFLYGDAGYTFPWLTDKEKNVQRQQYGEPDFRGSWYYDAGLGYRIPFNSDALLLSVGYCYKELKNHVKTLGCAGIGCSLKDETYRYHMPRVVIKAGWRF